MPDIDIDVSDRSVLLGHVRHVPASMYRNEKFARHPSGVYFQSMPVDPSTGFAAIPYDVAGDCWWKIDVLNNSIYAAVKSRQELVELNAREPNWELLMDADFSDKLPHLGGHHDIVMRIMPTSRYDLAVVLALIRPGKRYLLNASREEIEANVWTPDKNGYTFKKSHSIAYAHSIAVAMNIRELSDLSG